MEQTKKKSPFERAWMDEVEKPARYSGGEWNMCVKPPEGKVRFALCFPDVYEVGMSHLGSRILYHTLNARGDVYCERAFVPWVDCASLLRRQGSPLSSLETGTPLGEFDLLGVSLPYEMSYTNVLELLSLAAIPLRSAQRTGGPFIVAGGPCVCNCEPLAPFIDLAVLGEGEDVVHELVDAYNEWRLSGGPRDAFLLRAAQIRGVYVPSLYAPDYDDTGKFTRLTPLHAQTPQRVSKRAVKCLDDAPFPDAPIVPFMQIVHDRITLELFRGCTRGCRFCQAGFLYRPVRERSEDVLLAQAQALLASTGYEEISLSSLSSGDYSRLASLTERLTARCKDKRVGLSLPSLRVDTFAKGVAEDIAGMRKTGLTFAPEAGTQRLRDVINKGVTEQNLLRSVSDAFASGWNGVKLYFMLGLPTETDEDIEGIALLVRKVAQAYEETPREKRTKGLRISVSASNFVPKPHTPFQWTGQCGAGELQRKALLLRRLLKGIRGVDFHSHDTQLSVLEAVFARGDRRLADVLEGAWRLGCRFDAWTEHFRFACWQQAFEAAGMDMHALAQAAYAPEDALPWDAMDIWVDKGYLRREWQNALEGKTTDDCRKGCAACFGGMEHEADCAL